MTGESGRVASLVPLITESKALKREARQRRDPYEYVSIHPSREDEFVGLGWQLKRAGKTRLRLQREKPHQVFLEDRLWVLLHRLGYPELGGPNFRITSASGQGSTDSKQIDAFAKDDETVIIVECKSRENRGRRSLQKDIRETNSLQKRIADAVRAHYGRKFRPKIIWLYATQNIIWSDNDVSRAEHANIHIVTENELRYYEAFAGHIGPAGRSQFLAEFLEGQRIPNMEQVKVPAVRGKLGGFTYYTFVAQPRHLLKIAFVNHQALNHPSGRPAYQRMLSKSRIRQIGEFIKSGGYFPTNILVNFERRCRFDLLSNKDNSDSAVKFGWLHLPNTYKSAWIIDGQHRLFGFSHLPDQYWSRDLIRTCVRENGHCHRGRSLHHDQPKAKGGPEKCACEFAIAPQMGFRRTQGATWSIGRPTGEDHELGPFKPASSTLHC